MAISLAHKLTRRLAQVRKSGELNYLRPDGKAQVTVEYEDDTPVRVEAVVVSTQHAPEVSHPPRGMMHFLLKALDNYIARSRGNQLISAASQG